MRIKQVESFTYLGSVIADDGRSDTEIRRRIGSAKTAYNRMRPLLANMSLRALVSKSIRRSPGKRKVCRSNPVFSKTICLIRDLDLWHLLTQVDARSDKPGRGWPPYNALGYRMAIVCALYTARYTSVPSPL